MRNRIALLSFAVVALAACGSGGNGELLSVSGSTNTSAVTTTSVATATGPSSTASGTSTTVASATVPTTVPVLSDEMIKLLTVERPETDCVKLVREAGVTIMGAEGVKMYWSLIEARLSVGNGGRVDSDSIGTPLAGATPEEIFKSVQVAACEDPYVGSMVANYFANLTLNSRKIVEMNDWLKPFAGKPEEIIHVMAAKYESKSVVLATPGKPTADEAKAVRDMVAMSVEWQGIAGKLNTLLSRFRLDGVQALQSSLNYHLRDGGLVAGGLPITELNPRQENLPALVLSLTEKGQCSPILMIGFNVQDRRLEEFTPPTCAPPPAPPSSAPPTTDCRRCGPTTTAPPTTQPTTTAPPTTVGTTTTTVVVTTTTEEGKDHTVSPPTTVVVVCLEGYHLPRDGKSEEDCVKNAPPPTTTTTTTVARTTTTLAPATTSPPVSTTIVDSGDGQGGQEA